MNKYYLFSGFDANNGFTKEIGQKLYDDIKDTSKIVFISSSPYNHEKSDRYAQINYNWFKQCGINFKEYQVLDNRIPKTEAQRIVSAAPVVFLMGGDTLAQIEYLKSEELFDALKKYNGTVLGLSAGAINMARKALCSKDKDVKEPTAYEGLGLVDITVEPHFMIDNKEVLNNELYPLSYTMRIYGITDNSAIRVANGHVEYFGEIYRIENGDIALV